MSNAGELWILRAATSTEKCGRRRRDPAPSRRARRPRWPPGSCPCAGSHFRGDGVLSPRREERAGEAAAPASSAASPDSTRRSSTAGRVERRPRGAATAAAARGARGAAMRAASERAGGAPTPAAARAVRVAPPWDRGAAYRRARGSRSPSCPKGQARAGSHDAATRHRSPRSRLAGGGGWCDAAAELSRGGSLGAARGRELRRSSAEEGRMDVSASCGGLTLGRESLPRRAAWS